MPKTAIDRQYESIVSWVLSCRVENNREWMIHLRERLNKLNVLQGSSKRVAFNGDGFILRDIGEVGLSDIID